MWLLGTIGAFLLTTGAFLLLANLGSNASERSLEPRQSPTSTSPPLEIKMNESRLQRLRAAPGQTLPLVVSNQGQSAFSEVNLTLRVYSEDTALFDSSYYRRSIERLEAGESETIRFSLDLSPAPKFSDRERARTILEVQATTPEGISALKTAVLPFPDDSSI